MIHTTLQQLGFSDKEIAVYLAVLKRGKILPTEVAKLTNLNRSTVYSVAAELKKRGVLTEDLGGPVRYLVALPPEDLMQLASQEERELQKKKLLITEAIGELQSFVTTAVYTPPKIAFITQEEIRDYLYKRTDEWNSSVMKTDKVWWGFQDHTFVEFYQDWIDWYWTVKVPPGFHLTLLSNKSDTEREMKKKKYSQREIRYWENAGQFTTTVWVCGDYLIMIATHQEPHYLVEIHDAALAYNMREVFKGIVKSLN